MHFRRVYSIADVNQQKKFLEFYKSLGKVCYASSWPTMIADSKSNLFKRSRRDLSLFASSVSRSPASNHPVKSGRRKCAHLGKRRIKKSGRDGLGKMLRYLIDHQVNCCRCSTHLNIDDLCRGIEQSEMLSDNSRESCSGGNGLSTVSFRLSFAFDREHLA